ncbi:MAG: 1-acyl-sn-glycerol-3-phosphate acyltransferase [Lachnospiraceae bacterium]|nr:1-acyl-sn-glycerol-3-phosphate acyltransferase [Lachnospiraceae bacterium]
MEQTKHKIFRIDKFFMDLSRFLLLALIPVFRVKKIYVGSKEKIKSGVLIAANHTGFKDPLILETAFWTRRMFYVVAEVVMQNKIRNKFMEGAGCIKIDRNIADTSAIKKCVSVLKEGFALSIFPQGAISGNDAGFKSGVALIASLAKVPILPVYIEKRKNFFARQVVVIGEPFRISDYCDKKMPSVQDLEMVTEKLYEKYEECRQWTLKQN